MLANASEMIDLPTLTMNRVHQAPIAKEIIGCSTAGLMPCRKAARSAFAA